MHILLLKSEFLSLGIIDLWEQRILILDIAGYLAAGLVSTHLLDACSTSPSSVAMKIASRYCQISTGGQDFPFSRTTG